MSRFYTNVAISGSNVLVREIVDGIPNMRKAQWSPTLYVNGRPRTVHEELRTLDGGVAYSVQPGTIVECKDFVKQYENVGGFEIFGQLNYSQQYMHEYKPTGWTYDKIQSWCIDIETDIPEDENGVTSFPQPKDAEGEILLITMCNMHSGEKFTFGSKAYIGEDTHYTDNNNEYNLLKMFLMFWEQKKIDIITGWNISQFDLPYLYNRIDKVMGDEWVNKLSPWGKVYYKHKIFNGKDDYTVRIDGVSVLDYIDLYKKYVFVKHESYSLQHIAQEELGHTKLDHSEFKSFNDFHRGDWDKFVRYNVVDTELVKQIDDKLQLISIVLTMAYEARLNYEDVSSPVKLWDAITANYCMDSGVVVPQQQRETSKTLDGAYVKEPVPGWYKNVVSLDATSLYPSIIVTNNISPETYVGNNGLGIDDFLGGVRVTEDEKYIVTPAGALYTKEKVGMLPTLVKRYMVARKTAKKEMLRLEQEYENTKDKKLKSKISALDNLQMTYKIALNSLYGATANEYFRFYKHDHAASITLTGQYVLRTIESKIDVALNTLFKTDNVKYLIYIDTDSLYFTLDAPFKKFGVTDAKAIATIEKLAKDKITPLVNEFCEACCANMRSIENQLNFKLEATADKAIWLGKKKYVLRVHSSEGVTYAKPKYKAKGLEMVRSSTPRFVREQLKKSLEVIFDTDEPAVQKFVADVKTEFMKLPYTDVAFPRGANNLEEYSDKNVIYKKGCPLQVRGVLLYNHYLKTMKLDGKYPLIGEGEKIKFAYMRMPNKFKENVIAWPVEGVIPKEFKIIEMIDYDIQFEKTFLSSMELVLDAIGWNAVETSSLNDFFG